MKKIKFASLLISCIMLIALMAACGTKSGSGEKQKLVMGTSADYPPYEFIDTANGEEIIGFDIDIANYIADALGFELEIQDMDFSGLIPALTNNRVDFVIAGMTPTEDRLKSVDFTVVYYTAEQTIVTKNDSGIQSLEDLQGKILGVQLGSIQEGIAEEISEEVGGVEIAQRNRITDLIQELLSGRIDAAIIENTVGQGHVDANPVLTSFVIEEETEAGSAIALPKGSELTNQFNEVLQEMFDNGTMEELIVKWFSGELE
ncbi:MAG: transporter substrate-binding domain-containing protein [Bacillaceae bacterium]|nr:transporter substrate-binding domain-containing protein [Bacillaceae bacterium]